MLRAAFHRWLAGRLPVADSSRLAQRNLYILPTTAGLAFAATLLLMLVASINYQLNLGYVLTFLLAGAGVVSMHLTHNTLRGLTLHLRPPQPAFAGDAATVEVVLTNPGRERHGIALRWRAEGAEADGGVWTDVPAHGQATVHLSFVPPARGVHPLPMVTVETVFPFGLFRAWHVWRPASTVLAWPRPEQPAPPLPPAAAAGGPLLQGRREAGTELEGVRAYRRGDSLRHVVWKKVAKNGQLVSRETRTPVGRELWLDWLSVAGADGERRLARLAAWVQAAEHAGIAYGLRLPGREIAPGHGELHRRAALDLLATF